MYNIDSHYNFILQHVKINHNILPKIAYFFPFGSTTISQLELVGPANPNIFFLCYDQEPLNYNYNFETFSQYDKLTVFANKSQSQIKEVTQYSQYWKDDISLKYTSLINKEKIPTILLNTEKDSDEKNKILNKFNYVDCYYFYHALAAVDWFRGNQFCSEIIPIKKRKIQKKFITFNRITGNSRIYRAFFVSKLSQQNLLDSGHISFSSRCPVHGNLQSSIIKSVKQFNLDKNFVSQELDYIANLPNLRIDSDHDTPIKNSSFTLGPIQKSMESFVHVVTETCFWERKKHLTEKIFKPIALKQPFLLLGCADNLAYLKEYGFKTFDRWWDESYDKCQDPIKRIDMVVDIVKNLSKLSNHDLENILHDMEEVLEYNFQLFYSQQFVNHIWNELQINLDAAIVQASAQTFQEKLNRSYFDINHYILP
jgi:hypothetical protein